MDDPDFDVVCAWCVTLMRRGTAGGGRISHGICAACAADSGLLPVDDLSRVDSARLDALPFGVVRVVGDGQIVAYNRAESELSGLDPARVVGKHFFRDIAPCTAVQEFQGRLLDLRERSRDARDSFSFVFRFERRSTIVHLALAHDMRSDTSTTLVRTD